MKRFLTFCALPILYVLIIINFTEAKAYKVDDQEVDDLAVCRTIELRFFLAVNEYRAKLELSQLNYDFDVADICKQHANNLNRFDMDRLTHDNNLRVRVAHENYDYRSNIFRQIVRNNGQNMQGSGEIVFPGISLVFDDNGNLLLDKTVESLLAGFLKSPSHKVIIETACNIGSYFGAGTKLVKDSQNRIIFVANFVGIN